MPVVENADAVRVRVPAKVNLHLSVGAVRPDGFHELTTVFQAVALFDDVIARAAAGLGVTADGTFAAGVPTDHTNLAFGAAELLAAHAGADPDVLLELHKAIPVAGGMAGGSADAAGALVACAALWRTGTQRAELAELAALLGSDVPFALFGGTALGVGRGEQLTPVLSTGEYHWVLALSDTGLATAEVYRELDRLRDTGAAAEPAGPPDELLDALRAGDCGRAADALANDLQPAALSLRPELAEVLAAGAELGALGGVVSGSGPTCAFLCAHADAASDLADELDRAGVCAATRVATAPAPGARITG
ncbi:MAG TPA: 4-(cytidine 5'-diphospho)-2-C-methyl-D-erythritol kinase [Jatrophihabitans sp.]|jgi:4-diphosphocytidyl-2-C-methyl-D-erythritol kinase